VKSASWSPVNGQNGLGVRTGPAGLSAPGDLPHPLPSTVKDLLAALSLSSERRASSWRVVGEARGLGTYSVRQSARSGKFGRRQSGWQDVNAGSNPQGDFLQRAGQVCRCGRNIGRGAQAQAAAIFPRLDRGNRGGKIRRREGDRRRGINDRGKIHVIYNQPVV